MSALTLSYHTLPGDEEVAAVDAIVGAQRATVRWSHSSQFGRAYALVEDASDSCASALREHSANAFNRGPIIALAIVPSVDEALPAIHEALAGPGAPAGMASCARSGNAVVVEWDLDRSSAEVVLGLIDVELARFKSQRTTYLLSPLPLAWTARIAAEGLGAPEIAPDRVLEALLKEHHVGR